MTQTSLFKSTVKNIIPKDGEAYYYPKFLTKKQETELFEELKDNCHWQQEEISLFGKKILSPRLTTYYGTQAYTYSKINHPAKEYPESIKKIILRLKEEFNIEFNSVLLNYYRDGKDSMGWHQDNEKELGNNPSIASLNLGANRKFSFKHIKEKDTNTSIHLEGGSLLLMKGSIQHHWKHQLPKTSKNTGERINLTFRCIKYPH